MNDIEFIVGKNKFKYRVCGIVIKNDKVLIIKSEQEGYYLPGGHAEFGEDSKEALFREMKEETETDMKIKETLSIVENFYADKNDLKTHEISFYYIVEPENYNKIKLENYSRIENDKGKLKQIDFEWVQLDKLKDVDLRPKYIKNKLLNKDYSFEHISTKDEK